MKLSEEVLARAYTESIPTSKADRILFALWADRIAELEEQNLNLMVAISYFLEREDMSTWLYSRSTAEELARKLLDQEE